MAVMFELDMISLGEGRIDIDAYIFVVFQEPSQEDTARWNAKAAGAMEAHKKELEE